jgi:hypothetical protein
MLITVEGAAFTALAYNVTIVSSSDISVVTNGITALRKKSAASGIK